jgi:hypothetical protein
VAAAEIVAGVHRVVVALVLAERGVAGKIAQVGVGVEHPVDAPDVAVIHRQTRQRRELGAGGIEGLFVLPPGDAAEKALAAVVDALAAGSDPRVAVDDVAEPGLVDLGVIGIGDHGILGLAVGGVVERLAAQVGDIIHLHQPAEAAHHAGLHGDPRQQGGGIRVLADRILIHVFIAVAEHQIDVTLIHGLADLLGKAIRPGGRRTQRQRQRRSRCQREQCVSPVEHDDLLS